MNGRTSSIEEKIDRVEMRVTQHNSDLESITKRHCPDLESMVKKHDSDLERMMQSIGEAENEHKIKMKRKVEIVELTPPTTDKGKEGKEELTPTTNTGDDSDLSLNDSDSNLGVPDIITQPKSGGEEETTPRGGNQDMTSAIAEKSQEKEVMDRESDGTNRVPRGTKIDAKQKEEGTQDKQIEQKDGLDNDVQGTISACMIHAKSNKAQCLPQKLFQDSMHAKNSVRQEHPQTSSQYADPTKPIAVSGRTDTQTGEQLQVETELDRDGEEYGPKAHDGQIPDQMGVGDAHTPTKASTVLDTSICSSTYSPPVRETTGTQAEEETQNSLDPDEEQRNRKIGSGRHSMNDEHSSSEDHSRSTTSSTSTRCRRKTHKTEQRNRKIGSGRHPMNDEHSSSEDHSRSTTSSTPTRRRRKIRKKDARRRAQRTNSPKKKKPLTMTVWQVQESQRYKYKSRTKTSCNQRSQRGGTQLGKSLTESTPSNDKPCCK